jgi:hypothetical protein
VTVTVGQRVVGKMGVVSDSHPSRFFPLRPPRPLRLCEMNYKQTAP